MNDTMAPARFVVGSSPWRHRVCASGLKSRASIRGYVKAPAPSLRHPLWNGPGDKRQLPRVMSALKVSSGLSHLMSTAISLFQIGHRSSRHAVSYSQRLVARQCVPMHCKLSKIRASLLIRPPNPWSHILQACTHSQKRYDISM